MFDLIMVIVGIASLIVIPFFLWHLRNRLTKERTEQIQEEREDKKLKELETRYNDVLHELLNLLEK